MTTVHAQLVGDRTILPRVEFEKLVRLAGLSDQIELEVREEDLPTAGLMRLAEHGGAFDWLAEEDELYTIDDLKVRYR